MSEDEGGAAYFAAPRKVVLAGHSITEARLWREIDPVATASDSVPATIALGPLRKGVL